MDGTRLIDRKCVEVNNLPFCHLQIFNVTAETFELFVTCTVLPVELHIMHVWLAVSEDSIAKCNEEMLASLQDKHPATHPNSCILAAPTSVSPIQVSVEKVVKAIMSILCGSAAGLDALCPTIWRTWRPKLQLKGSPVCWWHSLICQLGAQGLNGTHHSSFILSGPH